MLGSLSSLSFSHTDGLTLVHRGGQGPLKSSSLLHRADSCCEVLGFLITDEHLHSGVVVVPAALWFFLQQPYQTGPTCSGSNCTDVNFNPEHALGFLQFL